MAHDIGMSSYTSLGVTVSPEVSVSFLMFIRTIADSPDYVCREKDGSVSAVWENRNHFDAASIGSEYLKIIGFLKELGEMHYVYESVTDDESFVGGRYHFGFARVVRYEMYGEMVNLKDAIL